MNIKEQYTDLVIKLADGETRRVVSAIVASSSEVISSAIQRWQPVIADDKYIYPQRGEFDLTDWSAEVFDLALTIMHGDQRPKMDAAQWPELVRLAQYLCMSQIDNIIAAAPFLPTADYIALAVECRLAPILSLIGICMIPNQRILEVLAKLSLDEIRWLRDQRANYIAVSSALSEKRAKEYIEASKRTWYHTLTICALVSRTSTDETQILLHECDVSIYSRDTLRFILDRAVLNSTSRWLLEMMYAPRQSIINVTDPNSAKKK